MGGPLPVDRRKPAGAVGRSERTSRDGLRVAAGRAWLLAVSDLGMKRAVQTRIRSSTRSPRAACLRVPSRPFRAMTTLADDAADRPRGQVKRGGGSASGAGPSELTLVFPPDQPCQVCEEAGVERQVSPYSDGRRERSGTCLGRRQLGRTGESAREPCTTGWHNPQGRFGRSRKRRRARVHRVRRGRPSRSPQGGGVGWASAHVIPFRVTGADQPASERARNNLAPRRGVVAVCSWTVPAFPRVTRSAAESSGSWSRILVLSLILVLVCTPSAVCLG
jgi:hypothetical protein